MFRLTDKGVYRIGHKQTFVFFAQTGMTAGKWVGVIENDHCLPIALNEPKECTCGLKTAWKKALDTESFFHRSFKLDPSTSCRLLDLQSCL